MIRPFKLGKFLNYLERLKINSDRCIKNKSALSRCNLCANVCPEKGLSFYNGKWEVTSCRLCGRCVMLCPCEVFSIDEKKILEKEPSEHLILTCQQDKTIDFGVKINCFKALSPELLFYLLKRHEKVSLVVSHEICKTCENDYSAETLLLLLKRYHICTDKLSLLSKEDDIEQFMEQFKSSRRAYLASSYKRLLNQSADVALDEMVEMSLIDKENLPLRRTLLYKAYKDEMTEDTLPYPVMHINHCHFCGACEKLCPEEAIKIVKKEEKKYLLFQPVLCHFCKLCENICIEKGIVWGDYITKKDFFSGHWRKVAEAKETSCAICGKNHCSYEMSEVCYFCKQKDR